MAHRVKRMPTNAKRENLRKENEEWVTRMRTKRTKREEKSKQEKEQKDKTKKMKRGLKALRDKEIPKQYGDANKKVTREL